jgi:hypothetical protein
MGWLTVGPLGKGAGGAGMTPGSLKLLIAGVAVALILAIGAAWRVQDWRYSGQLAEQANAHLSDLAKIGSAAAGLVQAEQGKRLALEQQLTASDQTHHRALSNAQRDQDRLHDRLATADVRLSVLLDQDSASSAVMMTNPSCSPGSRPPVGN